MNILSPAFFRQRLAPLPRRASQRASRIALWMAPVVFLSLMISSTVAAVTAPSPSIEPLQPLPQRDPQAAGLMPQRLAVADQLVAEAVAEKGVPGAVLLVARRGSVALRKAYGFAALRPQTRAMTTETVFDIASLTKPVFATALMRLVEDGKIELDAPVGRYLPAFEKAGGDKARITIRQLMTHASGLSAGGAYSGKKRSLAQIVNDIVNSRQRSAPGEAFLYSDYSFVTMGAVVEAVTGKTLDVFCRETLFEPLGMTSTSFVPSAALRERSAATTSGDDTPESRGVVHDPTARALGGVSGNAGLFSTADDLAVFCQMLLNGGQYGGKRVLAAKTVALMTSKQSPFQGNARGLGWDLDSGYSVRGALSPGSFGHTGFTGTSIWIDPATQTFIVLLTNSVHAKPVTNAVLPLRRAVSNAVAAAIDDAPLEAGSLPASLPVSLQDRAQVQTGLDVLVGENFARLEGKNVGVVSNHTAVDRHYNHLVDLMFANKKIHLVALFGPEHGIRGDIDDRIGDSLDKATGLKVYSLYDYKLPAAQRYRPTPEMLRGIDTLVFDVQDIGARYYTYISTLGYLLEEASKAKIRVLVLDRPNPLGGLLVEGPELDLNFRSFAGYYDMPITHGMTIGELALMFNAERKIGADLEVVQMTGWNRRLRYDGTGLPWVDPSPNIRSVRQAALYPGIGFLEVLPISVGRGTDTPFEIIGAPWIDGVALADNLNARRLPGVSFVATRFTPRASTHAKTQCGGVQIFLWDRRDSRPSALGIEIADALARLYPQQINEKTLRGMRGMVGKQSVADALAKGTPPNEIVASWSGDVADWRKRRAPFLLYR